MARILIVGCGCRGTALGEALVEAGHVVRGTSRDEAKLPRPPIEGVVADPSRLATLTPHLAGVTIVCWLMGSADSEELHGERLEALMAHMVDTPVRGVLYEACGSARPELFERGTQVVRGAAATWQIPVEVVDAHGGDWLAATTAAVGRLLGGS